MIAIKAQRKRGTTLPGAAPRTDLKKITYHIQNDSANYNLKFFPGARKVGYRPSNRIMLTEAPNLARAI